MQKKLVIYYLVFISIFSFFIFSCGQIFSGKNISEGSIEFEITYLEDERENPLIVLLPSSMELKFKNNSTVSRIEGVFGTFKLTYISDSKKGLNSSLLKVMDQKYIYEVDTNQPAFGYNAMRNLKIRNTGKKKIIAGYNCNQAVYFCPEISNDSIFIYYTNEIDIVNPNTNNPFKQINGVLLEFIVKLNDIRMHFVAKKVKKEPVDDKEFVVPKGYKSVSKTQMEQVFEEYNFNNKKK